MLCRDKQLSLYTSSFYANSTTCDVNAFNMAQGIQPSGDPTVNTDFTFISMFAAGISVWLPITAVSTHILLV